MRTFLGISLALLLTAGQVAEAQVAVPEVSPAATRVFNAALPINPMTNITPENPAALTWGLPSRLVGAALEGEKDTVVSPGSDSYQGSLVGFRWVGEGLALAAEAVEFSVEYPGGVPHEEKEQRSVAIAFAWPDWLALGFASESLSNTQVNTVGVKQQIDYDTAVVGLSMRLGENVYFGAALGEDEGQQNAPVSGVIGSRYYRMAGLGLRGGGSVAWHLEIDGFSREDLETDSGALIQRGYDLTLAVAEMIWSDWLLGVSGYDGIVEIGVGPELELSGYTVDFGLAPLKGLNLVWRWERGELSQNGQEASAEEINHLVLGWMF